MKRYFSNSAEIATKNTLLTIGFNGNKFQGSTFNNEEGNRTVEKEIQNALEAAFIIDPTSNFLQKHKLFRSSRVDKGVSAMSQHINLLLPREFTDQDIKQRLKRKLPQDIWIYDAIEVSNDFDCKSQAESRSYYYYLPAFCLAPLKLSNEVKNMCDTVFKDDALLNTQKKDKIIGLLKERNQFEQLYATRISDNDVSTINSELLPNYIGTRWFHNYISKKYQKQFASKRQAFQSYKRTLTEFKIDKVQEIMGIQMVRFALTGSSFGYQQIRKMMSSVVEQTALQGDIQILKDSFDSKLMKHNNNAPSKGLLLWRAIYGKYNSNNEHQKHIELSDQTLKDMETRREHVAQQIVQESEIQDKDFTYFLIQSLHTLSRTQQLNENTFLNKRSK